MPRSLRGRLITLLALLAAAAVASGFVMFSLFRQSASAQLGQAQVLAARACDAIGATYRFYTTGWHPGEPNLEDPALKRDLAAVVVTALRDRPGMEGGLWQADTGSVAYAYPTYEGSGPKTDLPQAEAPRIRATNQAALNEDRPQLTRVDSRSQTLLIAACPLPGPIPGLTAWTLTRIHTFAGSNYRQLMMGLAILFLSVLAASVAAAALIVRWTRHVGRIEAALGRHDVEDLPVLPRTGERELDRIVLALNDVGQRLAASRERAEQLSRQIVTGERLAAIGRVAAGVAHEIRNPIAAMRLKAETALAGSSDRKDQALHLVIDQVDRLEGLVRRLLTASERDAPHPVEVAMAGFLESCVRSHAELMAATGASVAIETDLERGFFDPVQMRRALDNLVLNAMQVEPGNSLRLGATRRERKLVFTVADRGGGPPASIRDHLFEPFVTGRAEGTGLGLSIVREIAEAHGGVARFTMRNGETVFEIEIPWQPS